MLPACIVGQRQIQMWCFPYLLLLVCSFLDSFPKYLVARVKDKSCLIVKSYYKENTV